jgi:hypothetical protein
MTIREQAEYHRLLLAMGLAPREEVINWADQLILRGAVPVEVIDVSLAVDKKPDQLDALLAAVPGEGNLERAAYAVLSRFKRALRGLSLRDAVKKIVRYGDAAAVPEQQRQDARLFDVLYEHAVVGYGGSEAETRQRLEDFVNRYAMEPAGADDEPT